ncbi:MFS transporter [Glutamicibacter sp.]|uniref:MFS transporter n=1 Tax=Glutamicibacter sp. TaxID=1931995 RepID=UPI0028BEF9CE|nr:MFS transporter [Glutamicibacter sp.]
MIGFDPTESEGEKLRVFDAQKSLVASNAADAAGRGLYEFTLEMLFVVTLSASAFQMGMLNALGSVAFVAATIPAGYLVDRAGAVKILRLGLGAKVALLASLLVLDATGTLNIPVALTLATLMGACNVFGETSQVSAVPEVDREGHSIGRLIARLAATDQALAIVIPAIAGTLFTLFGSVPMLGASLTIALSALGLAFTLSRARTSTEYAEKPAPVRPRGNTTVFGGMSYLFGHRSLLALTFATMFCNLGLAIGSSVEALFVINELELGAQGYGLYAAVGGVGGLIGAAISTQLAQRYTPSQLALPSMLGQIVFSSCVLLANYTSREWAIALLTLHAFGWGIVLLIFNIAISTWVVEITPEDLLGRVLSARRLFTFGVVPLGGVVGGFIGTQFGIQAALAAWVGATCLGLLCFVVLRPRLTILRDMEPREPVAE